MTSILTQRFPIFIIVYFVIQIFIRLATTHIAVLDESEQIMLSQYFALGYNEQPPLYTWLQMGVFHIFGISILGLSLLKNTLLCLTYLFIYGLGMLFMQDKTKASLSALSLFLIPQMVWDAQIDQTHTVFLTMATTATLYTFFTLVKRTSSLIWFILFGISSGVGLLAKYNFILVLIALGFVALIIPNYRKTFFTKKLLVSIVIAFCMVLPHFMWFLGHLATATQRTIDRMNVGNTHNVWLNFLKGESALLISIVAFLSPFWIFFLAFFRKRITKFFSPEAKMIFIYLGVICTLLIIVVALSGSTHVKERWLQPYLIIVPFLFFLHLTSLENNSVRRFSLIAFSMPILVALVVLIRPWLIDIREKPTRASYPFEELVQELRTKISSTVPILVEAEDKYIGGNIKLFMPNTTVITPSLANQPYTLTSEVLIVWENEKPQSFSNMLQSRGYSCQSSQLQAKFQKSNLLEYTLFYERCVQK